MHHIYIVYSIVCVKITKKHHVLETVVIVHVRKSMIEKIQDVSQNDICFCD